MSLVEPVQPAPDPSLGALPLPTLEWVRIADDRRRPLEGDYCIVAHFLVTGDYASSLATFGEDGRFTTWLSRRPIPNVTHWLRVTPNVTVYQRV